MSKTKALLGRYDGGTWPDAPTPALTSPAPSLTAAARRLVEETLADIRRADVVVTLDAKTGRVRFSSRKVPPVAVRRAIEVYGDAIEVLLREDAAK